jgi:predicted kinase
MTNLYLPIAPPGAGKSHLARLMVEAGMLSSDAVVSPDFYRKLLTGDENDQSENDTIFWMVREIVATRTLNGLDTYLDATNLSGAAARLLRKLPSRDDVWVVGVDFGYMTPLALHRQNEGRERVVPRDIMERMIGGWNASLADPSFWNKFDERLRASTLIEECERIIELEAHPVMDAD